MYRETSDEHESVPHHHGVIQLDAFVYEGGFWDQKVFLESLVYRFEQTTVASFLWKII